MKRHLAPSLFALALCALLGGARAAEAQGVHAIVPAPADSVVTRAQPVSPDAPAIAPANVASVDLAPVMRPSFVIPVRSPRVTAGMQRDAEAAVFQGRNWKMPTSRTLMIGGTAVAIIGLVAVKGDTGAIMAMAGGGVAVYGLYLHYNH